MTRIGIVAEAPGETRVAATPTTVPKLIALGYDVVVEAGAGAGSSFPDAAFARAGATLVDGATAWAAPVVLKVNAPTPAEIDRLADGATIVATLSPALRPDLVESLAVRGITALALDAVPRISRAQSMDVLSSMANVAGYRAVIEAAHEFGRLFTGQVTAAGKVPPARVFVVGAGVAGLQAIATARRLGAKVEAYDVRPAVKEQVQSMGAKFVELPLETQDSEDKGGYAKAQDENFYRRQREMMLKVVAASDVIVTTALIPGKPAPKLITTEMVEAMAPGSVIVDLAAERGGNCDLTRADETVVHRGVTIIGPSNPAALAPYHASQMYSKNILTFLMHLLGKEGAQQPAVPIDPADEITRETLLTREGQLVHPRVKELVGG